MYWWERNYDEWWNHPGTKDTTDFQRSKIYSAEKYAAVAVGETREAREALFQMFATEKEVEKFIKRVISYAWFVRRFGRCTIEFRVRRECNRAEGNCYSFRSTESVRSGYIIVPPSMWRTDYILHEMVHAVQLKKFGSGHGRWFAKAMMDVFQLGLPKEISKQHHEALRAGYKLYGVKHNPKRQLKVETREKLRKNFVKNCLRPAAATSEEVIKVNTPQVEHSVAELLVLDVDSLKERLEQS